MLAVVSTLVVLVVLNGQKQQTIDTLDQAIASTRGDGIGRRDPDDSALRNVAVAVWDGHGFRVDGVMPPGLPDRALMRRVARTGKADQRQLVRTDRYFAVRTDRHGDDTVQAVLDLREQRAELARLLQAIVVGGAIGVLLVSGVAVLLARRAVRPLADALTLQQRFVADAAHELRTPLTLLSTRAQLLGRRLRQAGVADQATRTALETGARDLVADSANLTEILEDLLLAADRTAELPAVPLDLAALTRQAVAAAEPAAAAAGISIRLVVDTDDETAARLAAGSRPAILRAANALIDNAVTHARAQVDVTLVPRPGAVELDVADDGPGIDAQTLPAIFDRFASGRAAGNSGSGRRHYGLGLALVSDVASRHGGTVTAEARPDGRSGALLRLRLPTSMPR